jgi:glutamyl-tRNA reductase
MELLVIGLSHKTAPVAVRERLAIVPGELEAHVRRLAAAAGMREAVVVSTCNRTEIYGAFSDADQAQRSVREVLMELLVAGGPLPDAEDPEMVCARHLYTRERREAVLHLFRVAASLDSLVVGEPQILGQIKEAYDLSLQAGAAGPLLGSVFSQAFRVARKVRRDTGIALAKVSVSSVAVDLARQVWGGFKGRKVLMVGAGKMVDLACRVLVREGATLAIVNRTLSKAEELAARLGGAALPWDKLREALVRADIVFASTGARNFVLTHDLVHHASRARHGASQLLIDIAVPRNIDPAVVSLNGVILWNIDALNQAVADNQQDRRQEADRAEAMIEQEITQFLARLRSRSAGPTIAALRAKATSVARGEAEKFLATLPSADERTRQGIMRLAESIANKFVHAPSTALKKHSAEGNPEDVDLIEAAHRMHDLPPVQPVPDQTEGDDADRTGADSKKATPT